jgi:hypothetical protein
MRATRVHYRRCWLAGRCDRYTAAGAPGGPSAGPPPSDEGTGAVSLRRMGLLRRPSGAVLTNNAGSVSSASRSLDSGNSGGFRGDSQTPVMPGIRPAFPTLPSSSPSASLATTQSFFGGDDQWLQRYPTDSTR